MTKRRFVCKRCGEKFEAIVFEPGEAEEKKRPTSLLVCPRCKSHDIQPT